MNVEEELRKIASMSKLKEELLPKILLARRIQREKGKVLSMEELDEVSAAGTPNVKDDFKKYSPSE